MRRTRFQLGGLTGIPELTGLGGITGFQTGPSPRPGMTDPTVLPGYVPPPPPELTLAGLSEEERAQMLAISQLENPYGPTKPDDWLQGLIWEGHQGLIDQASAKLSASDPAPGETGSDPLLGDDRSELGQVGGLEEILQRYETPRTITVEPEVEWVGSAAQPLGGSKTPSSLLQYLEHMRAKNTATFGEAEGMQYGGMPTPWHGAPPQQARLQAGPAKTVGMAPRQAGIMPGRQFLGGGQGIQAGPLPPGMGPGSGGPMAPRGSPFDMGQLRGPMGGGMPPPQQQQQQQRMQQMMARRRGAMGRGMGRRGPPPRRMMPQQARGQPPGGGGGGGEGMPGGPRVPPNLRGRMQQMRMQNRPAPGPGGNRIGGGDQRGAMARARQSQTGRQPISRRSAFPGRPR